MNIPIKIGQREKKFLIAGGIIVFLIFAYQFGVWYKNFRVSSKEYIESRQITLQKQLNKILQKAKIKNNFEAADTELKELEKGLVSGDTPPVAAAAPDSFGWSTCPCSPRPPPPPWRPHRR